MTCLASRLIATGLAGFLFHAWHPISLRLQRESTISELSVLSDAELHDVGLGRVNLEISRNMPTRTAP